MINLNLSEKGLHNLLYSLELTIDETSNKKFQEDLIHLKIKIKKAMRRYYRILNSDVNWPKVTDFRLKDMMERLNEVVRK